MLLPTPDREVVYLPSAGLDERRATLHRYHETRPALDANGGAGHEFIFRCAETGAERRYGFEGTRGGES